MDAVVAMAFGWFVGFWMGTGFAVFHFRKMVEKKRQRMLAELRGETEDDA